MNKTLKTLIPCLTMLGCAGGVDDDNGNGNGDGNGDGLGSILDRIERSASDSCEEFVTSEGLVCRGIAGSERFMAAQVTLRDDDTVTGRFYMVLYANEAWREGNDWRNGPGAEAERCVIAAAFTGTVNPDGGSCGACETSISYEMNGYDASLTTCPQRYVNDVRLTFTDAFWGFELRRDGSAAGWDRERQPFPNGVHQGNEIHAWSNGACEWYGTGECT